MALFINIGGTIQSNIKTKKEIEISKAAMENGYEQINGNWVKVVDKQKNSGKVEGEK